MVDDQPRRAAEVDEVRQAVELGAEARLTLDQARDAAVEPVERRGEHDRRQRPFELVLERQADGGQPRA